MKLREENRRGNMRWTDAGENFLICLGIVLFILIINISAVIRSDYCRGIPTTYEGEVVYISYEYNKWQDVNWTKVKIQITIEDVDIIYLWEHIEFDLGSYYEIETIRHIERGQRFPWCMQTYDKVIGVRQYN